MFQKNSFSIPSDTSGVKLVRVIETRKCSPLRHAKIGRFLKVVMRKTKAFLARKRKKKTRAIVVRTKHTIYTKRGLFYLFNDNSLVLLKKRMNCRGKYLLGPTSRAMRIKKFRTPYRYVF